MKCEKVYLESNKRDPWFFGVEIAASFFCGLELVTGERKKKGGYQSNLVC